MSITSVYVPIHPQTCRDLRYPASRGLAATPDASVSVKVGATDRWLKDTGHEGAHEPRSKVSPTAATDGAGSLRAGTAPSVAGDDRGISRW